MLEKLSNMSGFIACDGWDNSGCEGRPFCPPRCPRFITDEGTAYIVRQFETDDFASLVTMNETIKQESRTLGLPPTS